MPGILVIDDMPDFRDPIAASLRGAGYQVRIAANGHDAIEHIRRELPDLILMDLNMPGIDGLKLLSGLRGNSHTHSIPIIILTNSSDRGHILLAAQLGVHDYLLKSRFSLEDLLTRVKKRMPASPQAPSQPAAAQKPVAPPAPKAKSLAPPPKPKAPPGQIIDLPIPKLMTRDTCLQRVNTVLQAKTLSGVVAQVVAVASSPRGDMSQLATLISRDPMLSARILHVANSAAYVSSRGIVSTISDAVRHVGCSTVANIAASFGIFEAMPETAADGFNPIRCWQHSFGVATLCERLAGNDTEKGGAGAAYLSGLCHDLGEILFHTHFAREFQQILELQSQTGKRRDELERTMLGITHGELVSIIIKSLGLPDAIRRPIEAFHSSIETRGVPGDPLAKALRLAETYANGLLLASGGNALIHPFTRAECRSAINDENPAQPDGVILRSEIFSLTGMLAHLTPHEEASLMAPLYPAQKTRVLLVREPVMSAYDPIHAALQAMTDVTLLDHLPKQKDEADCQAMIVVSRQAGSPGFSSTDIDKAAALYGDSLPVLWLVTRDDTPSNMPSTRTPISGPITLHHLADFLNPISSP